MSVLFCARSTTRSTTSMIILVILSIIVSSSLSQYVDPDNCTRSYIPRTDSGDTNVEDEANALFQVINGSRATDMNRTDEVTKLSTTNFNVGLECYLRQISPTSLDFSLIQSQHTISLKVICDETAVKSRLEILSLNHLSLLKSLDIEHCKLQNLSGTTLRGLHQLQNLTLRTHNSDWALDLANDSLTSLSQLERLDLSYNYIDHIPPNIFCPLATLTTLNLSHNRISDFNSYDHINWSTGRYCLEELQHLDLSNNAIPQLSMAELASLEKLRSLYLKDNRISRIQNRSFSGLKNLEIIDLSSNLLEQIPTETFEGTTELKELSLRDNKLTNFFADILKLGSKLTKLDLSCNQISHINHFDLDNLLYLNLSHNKLYWFDYHLLPKSLLKLDVQYNEIEYIENALYLDDILELRDLNISYNELKEISSSVIPKKLKTIDLSHNQIRTVHHFSFLGKDISFVDLRYNSLLSVDINSFRWKPLSVNGSAPDLYLSNNPFNCDYSEEWLQWINTNDSTSKHFPKIVDLQSLSCQLSVSLPVIQYRSAIYTLFISPAIFFVLLFTVVGIILYRRHLYVRSYDVHPYKHWNP